MGNEEAETAVEEKRLMVGHYIALITMKATFCLQMMADLMMICGGIY